MNYLAHGYRFLDRPLFLAGTAVPDWLSVVDRKMRARARLVKPVVESTTDDDVREIGLGILQHHKDDAVFHTCEPFLQMESLVADEFRPFMPDKYDHRPAFLGHIVVELMLDATLAARDTTLLDRYYGVMDQLDASSLSTAINQMTTRQSDRIVWFIDKFREIRFLDDYVTDEGMLFRLNQVLKRIGLERMDDNVLVALAFARRLLAERADELLKIVDDSRKA